MNLSGVSVTFIALALFTTPAAAEICFEDHAPAPRPIASKPLEISPFMTRRVYVVQRRATRASDVKWLCPAETPADIMPMTVIYAPGAPIDLDFLPPSRAEPADYPIGAPQFATGTGSTWISPPRGFYGGGGYPTRDNPAGGNPTPTQFSSAAPEPAAWWMMILGFAGLGAMLRRRRRPA